MDLEHMERLHESLRWLKALDVNGFKEGQRFADILSYCQYAYNPALALAALEITTEISRRVDSLPRMLRPEVQVGLIEGWRRCWSSHFPSATSDDF